LILHFSLTKSKDARFCCGDAVAKPIFFEEKIENIERGNDTVLSAAEQARSILVCIKPRAAMYKSFP
jgi:hypothetical protein